MSFIVALTIRLKVSFVEFFEVIPILVQDLLCILERKLWNTKSVVPLCFVQQVDVSFYFQRLCSH